MKTVIEMAREAGLYPQFEEPTYFGQDWSLAGHGKDFERFAALVRADERDRAMRENAYVLAEREACAKVCESYLSESPHSWGGTTMAAAIRARGNI